MYKKLNLRMLNISLLCLLNHGISLAAENRALDAHIHGLSEMTIAIDKRNLEIEILSPASNIVGFEHSAITKTEIEALNNAKTLLNQYQKVFLLSGGNCELLEKNVDVSNITMTHNHTSNLTSGDREKVYQHDNKQVNHYSKETNHSEITAFYHYRCQDGLAVNAITVNLFDLFTGVEKIQAMWINERQQGAIILNANKKVIGFK